MKKGILLTVVILLSTAGLVQAQDELSGSIYATYMTSYIWRGFDYYADDHSAAQYGVDLDLYGSGFGVGVWGTRALGGGFVNSETLNVSLSYSNKMLESEVYATDYTIGWTYYGFPDESRSGSKTHPNAQAADMQDFIMAFSWPSIFPFGVVPSYTALAMWPSEGDSAARKNSGWVHIIGLGYDLAVPPILPNTAEQILNLSLAVVYNDGAAPGVVINAASGTVDHDWSHAVLGCSTNFDLGNNLSFTPGVYYQLSMEDTVNTEDEAWATLTMKYAF